ncbi:MAG: hypothetical protein RI907_3761, partial [Pseudomonadota bacterium]
SSFGLNAAAGGSEVVRTLPNLLAATAVFKFERG